MLAVDKKIFIFSSKTIHFCDHPYDVDGCDVVNFADCGNKVDVKGFTRRESFTSIIDLTQDLDVLWRNMDKKSSRYEIKRAEKEGIKLDLNQDYEQFYRLNKAFIQSKGFGSLLRIEIPKVEAMRKYGTLFTAEYSGEILGGHLYLEDEAHIRLWLSASKRLWADKEKAALIGRANRLLHWEAIKYAKEKGIKEFDWGGLWPQEEAERDGKKKAINSFKLSFGGEIVTRYSYQKAYSKAYWLAQYLYLLVNFGK